MLRRVAGAETGDRKYLVREREDVADRVGVVAQMADGAGAKPQCLGRKNAGLHGQRGIDRGVEETFEGPILDRVLADVFETPRVAEKHEKQRRFADLRHVRQQRGRIFGAALAHGAVKPLQPSVGRSLALRGARIDRCRASPGSAVGPDFSYDPDRIVLSEPIH